MITQELHQVHKWLTDEDKNSKYYCEYLDKVNKDLKLEVKQNK